MMVSGWTIIAKRNLSSSFHTLSIHQKSLSHSINFRLFAPSFRCLEMLETIQPYNYTNIDFQKFDSIHTAMDIT